MGFQKNRVISFLSVSTNIFWYIFIAWFILLALITLGLAVIPAESLPADASFSVVTPFMGVEFVHAPVHSWKLVTISMNALVLLLLAPAAAVVYYLRRIIRSVAGGTPFIPENVRSFRRIGLIVIAGSILQGIAGGLAGLVTMRNLVPPEGVQFNARFTLSPEGLFLGLVILVLAEIFRYGTELQQESDMTI